jgi:hypothetical protein
MCKSSILNVNAFSLLEIPTVLLQVLQSLDPDTRTAPIFADGDAGDREKLNLWDGTLYSYFRFSCNTTPRRRL